MGPLPTLSLADPLSPEATAELRLALRKCAADGRPVVIRGGASVLPAMKRWQGEAGMLHICDKAGSKARVSVMVRAPLSPRQPKPGKPRGCGLLR